MRTGSALGCPPSEGSQPGGCYQPVGALDDGTVVMASGSAVYAEGRDMGVKTGRPIELGAPQDGEWRRVAAVPQGDQFWARASVPGLPFAAIHPYPRLHGGRLKWAAGGAVVVEARSDSSDIRVRVPDGTLLRIAPPRAGHRRARRGVPLPRLGSRPGTRGDGRGLVERLAARVYHPPLW